MGDLLTSTKRLSNLCNLYLQMDREHNLKKFYELQKRFDEIVRESHLEDERKERRDEH